VRDLLTRLGATGRARFAVVLAATLICAVALGAVADWVLWQGSDAIWIILAAGALLVGALFVALLSKPGARRRSLFPLVVAVGLMLGMWNGPSRPELRDAVAAVTATLERPVTGTGEGRGSCQTAGSSELQLAAADIRLQIRADDPSAPTDIDQREFVSIYLTVGERWRDGAIHRSDNVDLMVVIGSPSADEPDVRLAAGDGSLIELAWTEDAGGVRFDRLVVDTFRNERSGPPVDLAGTISWSCGDNPLPDGAAEIAHTACAAATYASCVEDLLQAIGEMPGSLVAVCEFADGGAVIALEREEDATEWCAAEGPEGQVIEVLRLPGE
jgi:hypothetical protein